MKLPQNQQLSGRRGYSLVELLLTTSLLLLFAGLAVVSMQTLRQGSAFGEGTIRFETMVRFAHAEAARSGRRVRIDFIQETNPAVNPAVSLGTNQLSQVKLSWEPNPASEPDIFQDLLAPRWGVDQVNDTLRVADVRLVDGAEEIATNASDSQTALNSEPQASSADTDIALQQEMAATSPSAITFNPDGSCDAAEITLVGLAPEEDRRIIVRVDGITGLVSHKSIPENGEATNSTVGEPNRPASGPENRPSG
ncbi:MAG: GspH/FimT family pseudopilin [Verrucomicrobia bacterium]|nr:GspH/FimT family pseudopilin [Verrucomicrobiota bacterium]